MGLGEKFSLTLLVSTARLCPTQAKAQALEVSWETEHIAEWFWLERMVLLQAGIFCDQIDRTIKEYS